MCVVHALLARRPDHYKNFTVVGILLMALLGGIGGGVTRDVMPNKIPAAFSNPAYILLCLAAGAVGYLVAFSSGQLFREGLFQFMTSFSLPWYAIVGAQAAERRTGPSWACWPWRSSPRRPAAARPQDRRQVPAGTTRPGPGRREPGPGRRQLGTTACRWLSGSR